MMVNYGLTPALSNRMSALVVPGETSTPDFSQETEFTTLQSDVATLTSTASTQISGLDTRITTLENEVPTTYSLATPTGLQLLNSTGSQSNVAITASGGTTVALDQIVLLSILQVFKAASLLFQTDITSKADQSALDAVESASDSADATLQSNIDTNTNLIAALSTTVSALPTDADLNNYLLLAGGTTLVPLIWEEK